MDGLARFARALIERLEQHTGGVHRAVTVGDLRRSVLPYRIFRRELDLESVEDYETLVLRFVAEERGYARTFPRDAAERCREELALPNPDLGLVDELEDATVQVGAPALERILDPLPIIAEAFPELPSTHHPKPSLLDFPSAIEPPMPAAPHPAAIADRCHHCREPLFPPPGRPIIFCPFCGQRHQPFNCPRCGTELDSAWRHCITCGLSVQDSHRDA